MDAHFVMRSFYLVMFASAFVLAGCSKKGGDDIDAQAKTEVMSGAVLMAAKQNCIPNYILDEDDIPVLIGNGYTLINNQYCLPSTDPTPPQENCIPERVIDENDLRRLIEEGYVPNENGEYCLNLVPPGDTGGGTTPPGDTGGGTTPPGDTGGGTTPPGDTGGGTTPPGDTGGGTTPPGDTGGGTTPPDDTGGGTTPPGDTGGGTTPPGDTGGGTTPPGDAGGGTNPPGGGGSCDPDEEPICDMNTSEEVHHDCKPWRVPTDRMCSKMRTGDGRYGFLKRDQLILQIVKRVKKEIADGNHDKKCSGKKHTKHVKYETVYEVICESKDTDKIKSNVITGRHMDFSKCDISGLDKEDLFVTLFSPVVSGDLPISKYDYENVRFFEANNSKRGKDVLSFILYGSRDNRYANVRDKMVVIVDNNPDGESNDPKHCDSKASPLVVHVNPDHDVARYVELSSIEKGIRFDILGLNSEPMAHAPKRISWLNSTQYMFLVKPDKKGRVTGVDQMFGDNTYGPDKDFAPNGFLALAKYDANADGRIDSQDAVYYDLRLWRDKNFDGIGTPDEMVRLSSMRVKAIDLKYDPGFYEQDAYGNETVYKSVIQYEDGSLDLIFDLWFNYKE